MDNIFTTLTNKLPKATPEELEQLDETITASPFEQFKGKTLKGIVLDWQQDKTPEKTEFMLKKLKPTINSALTSFAPGMERSLQIKATKLALEAAKTYDPSYGTDPSTHVFHTLKRLYRYGSKRNNILPVSERGYAESKYIRELMAEFEDAKGREPSAMELADRSGFSVKKINKILGANKIRNDSSTLNPETQNSYVSSSDLDDDDYFEYVYASVGPTDQKIMEWSSGKHGRPILSNMDIAAKLHVTPAAISQRRAKLQRMMSDIRGIL